LKLIGDDEIISSMGKELLHRKLSQRIITGIIADASIGPFYKVSPDSTLKRLLVAMDEVTHPYSAIWNWIEVFYDLNGWSKLSDESLLATHKQIKKKGSCELIKPLSFPKSTITAWGTFKYIYQDVKTAKISVDSERILAAATRWDDYGWTNYEQLKSEKISWMPKTLKWSARGALFLSGLDFLAELEL
tara:strand:- start:474 stop:1040 length:567 start_codon:yes stop_codon:yes gene_type:complete